MAKKKKEKVVKQETTAQRLSGIIKSCRKIMRKAKGEMNGDADRLPMLTWIMFLKFLDDNEQLQEMNAKLESKKYKPAIAEPYRWRDWGKNKNLTGDDLIAFINNEKVKLADGIERTGLFYYLRGLQSETGSERKDVVATVFKGITNRMNNGYLLRDVINKIDEIHFTNNEEINTLSHLYESILKAMRDASGDAGEFYTPRPVVKFMVEMISPTIGETILDPASGTGGFLVEAFEYLKKQAKTIEQGKTLQTKTIYGGEPKSLPYLLCQMNLLLHGLEYPNIDSGNSLRFPLRDIGDNERVDVVLTNPPFGGEEERGILNNFPDDKKTAETALLFLQLIMRKLKRKKPNSEGGRAAVVVPNGTLFADGVGARIKKQLLEEFNLHTIVRLPIGVFAPYTDIPSNLLFFEHGKPTKKIWFYEMQLPEGRNRYNKTMPMQNEEFSIIKGWWKKRTENENAWCVEVSELINEIDGELNINLDLKNPNSDKSDSFGTKNKSVSEKLASIHSLITDIKKNYEATEIKNIFQNLKEVYSDVAIAKTEILLNPENINPENEFGDDEFTYIDVGSVEQYSGIITERKIITGKDAPSRARRMMRTNDVVFSAVRPNLKKAFIVDETLEGNICSTGYAIFRFDDNEIHPMFLKEQLLSDYFIDQCMAVVTGGHYPAINDKNIYKLKIILPPYDIQLETTEKVQAIKESFRQSELELKKKFQIEIENKFNREKKLSASR